MLPKKGFTDSSVLQSFGHGVSFLYRGNVAGRGHLPVVDSPEKSRQRGSILPYPIPTVNLASGCMCGFALVGTFGYHDLCY